MRYCFDIEKDKIIACQFDQLSVSDWNSVIQELIKQSLAPLLYHYLKFVSTDIKIPTDILPKLEDVFFQSAAIAMRRHCEFSIVLNALQKSSIPIIILKGAYLAENIYANRALRLMSDIDILVKKSDLLKAEKILLELGYKTSRKVNLATACATSQHIPPMVKQDSPPVELHWSIEAPNRLFTIDIEGLWQRARPATVAGVDTLTLSPEDLLLHLCLHTSVHHLYSNGLRAFCDIRETIRHYRDELDWETVQARAREWGVGNAVYLTLYLAKPLLGAEVSDDFLGTYRPDSFTPKMVEEAKNIIFNGLDTSASNAPHIVTLRNSESVLEITGVFLKRIFLPPEEMAEQYSIPQGSPRIFLYYLVRLKDLLVRHSRTVWMIWSRDKATARQFQLVDWLSR